MCTKNSMEGLENHTEARPPGVFIDYLERERRRKEIRRRDRGGLLISIRVMSGQRSDLSFKKRVRIDWLGRGDQWRSNCVYRVRKRRGLGRIASGYRGKM